MERGQYAYNVEHRGLGVELLKIVNKCSVLTFLSAMSALMINEEYLANELYSA